MFEKLKGFWARFWATIKETYNYYAKAPRKSKAQSWQDIEHINLLDIFITKLDNLTNYEATFEVDSDSTLAEDMKGLCKDLEAKRSDITTNMLADGDFFVFPSTDQNGNLFHSFLPQSQVRIVDIDGEIIRDAYGVIDFYRTNDNKTYYLLRRHKLELNGDLTISYLSVNDEMQSESLPKWEYLTGNEYVFEGANHIGFGRYKSPQKSRGLSQIYGVPLNFSCAEIEQNILNDLHQQQNEFANGESVIFTDPRNVVKKTDMARKGYKLVDNIIPVEKRAGDSGQQIEVYNPNLRFNEFSGKLEQDLELMEKQIGTSKGILSRPTDSSNATATEVRHINSDTLALVDKIRVAMDNGNRMTLEADGVFLNVMPDLWSYRSDWFDPYENPTEQWARLVQAKQEGAVGADDLLKWLYPTMTDEDVEEKLAGISERQNTSIDEAIERALGGA